MISHHFPHLQALFRLHLRLSWGFLSYLEADTLQTLLEASVYPLHQLADLWSTSSERIRHPQKSILLLKEVHKSSMDECIILQGKL